MFDQINFFSDTDVIKSKDAVTAQFKVPENSKIKHLEHVEVLVNIEYPVRGVLEVVLVSPGPQGSKFKCYVIQLLLIASLF